MALAPQPSGAASTACLATAGSMVAPVARFGVLVLRSAVLASSCYLIREPVLDASDPKLMERSIDKLVLIIGIWQIHDSFLSGTHSCQCGMPCGPFFTLSAL